MVETPGWMLTITGIRQICLRNGEHVVERIGEVCSESMEAR